MRPAVDTIKAWLGVEVQNPAQLAPAQVHCLSITKIQYAGVARSSQKAVQQRLPRRSAMVEFAVHEGASEQPPLLPGWNQKPEAGRKLCRSWRARVVAHGNGHRGTVRD